MSKFSLFNKFIVQEGKNEDMIEILLEASKSMEDLDECELYLVNTSDNEPSSIYVYEVWTNESSHQSSLSLEVTQRLITRAKPIINGMERISTLKTKGGKGISFIK